MTTRVSGLWWRQLLSERLVVSTVVIAAFGSAFLASAAPRVLERASRDHLRETVAAAAPEQRNIRLEQDTRIGPGPTTDPLRQVDLRGEGFRQGDFPAAVQAVLEGDQFVVDTPRLEVTSFPNEETGPFPTSLRFRYQEGIENERTVIEGELPQLRDPIPTLLGPECPDDRLAVDTFEWAADQQCRVREVPHFEVALTAQTAADTMLTVGDRALLRPDGRDTLWSPVWGSTFDVRVVVTVSGIIELSEPDRGFWYGDNSLHRPRVTENADYRLVFATAVAAPESYPEMLRAIPFVAKEHTWRYSIDPAALAAVDLDQLRTDLDKLAPRDTSVTTKLPTLINDFLERRALTVRLVSTTLFGLLAVGVAVLFVLGALLGRRQLAATELMADRGASRLQLLGLAARRAVVAIGPASLAGYWLAVVLVPDTDSGPAVRAALLVAAAGAALLVATSVVTARSDTRSGRGRLVAEGTVVVLGIAAMALLRRRGLIDETNRGTVVFDPLLALAPAVVGIAAGLITLHLYEPLVKATAVLVSRHRGIVSYVGVRRIATQSPAARIATLVVLLAVTVSSFSSVVHTSLARAQTEHGWRVTGADYRVTAHGPGISLPGDVLEVAAAWDGPTARAVEYPDTTLLRWLGLPRALVVAIEAEAYRDVLSAAGDATDAAGSLDLLAPEAEVTGAPLPVIVSQRWTRGEPPRVGDRFNLDLGSLDPAVVVAGAIESFPALPDEPFVIMSLDALTAIENAPTFTPTVLLLNGSDTVGDDLADTLRDRAPTAHVTSRRAVVDQVGGQPLARWTTRTFGIVFGAGILFAVVTAVASLALTARARNRDLTILRTLGLRRGQATAITAIEQLPGHVFAVAAGTGLGIGLARLLAPTLDLEIFSGADRDVRIVVDLGSVAAVAVMYLAALGTATLLSVVAHRRRADARMLRMGDE